MLGNMLNDLAEAIRRWTEKNPCMLLCDHHRSGWSGTILVKWCFEVSIFSDGWGIWPLLSLYIMVSIFISELNLDTGWGIWLLLVCSLWCPPIFIYQSWIWTLHYDWDFCFPSCTFIAGDSALHGFLAISSRLFVLVLLEIVWCREELSLHHVSMELCFSWTGRFGERTWGLREFCEPGEHCTEHL